MADARVALQLNPLRKTLARYARLVLEHENSSPPGHL
jgi:hypothetical protein